MQTEPFQEASSKMPDVDLKRMGFTRLTHKVFDALLVSGLDKTSRNIVNLIIRLTIGCQQEWATIRNCDFDCIGISSNHISKVIISLVANNVINRKDKIRYQVNHRWLITQIKIHPERAKRLALLVHNNLNKMTSQNGNSHPPLSGACSVHQMDVLNTVIGSGDIEKSPKNTLFSDPIDSSKERIDIPDRKEKIGDENLRNGAPNKIATPEMEHNARELFNRLESSNNEASFPFYRWAASRIDFGILCQFASEIEQDNKIREESRGKVFNYKVTEYLKKMLA